MPPAQRTLGLSVPVTEVLDPKLWRMRYVHTLLLGALRRVTAQTGRPGARREETTRVADEIPDEVIRWHLRTAMSELELKLGMPMGVRVMKSEPLDDGSKLWRDYDQIVPRLPFVQSKSRQWFKLDLQGPVLSVERVRGVYYDTVIWEVSEAAGNAAVIKVEHPRQGSIHIIPTLLQSHLLTNTSAYGAWNNLLLHSTTVPSFWAVDYTIGPLTRDGQPGHIEAALADWVYCVAGIKLLAIGGLAITRGLTGGSVSIDGASRSVAVQGSALYEALGTVFDQTAQRINWNELKIQKRGLRVIPFGSP